jgi:cytoskeletal protein CcmA (bactofilin family)
MKLDNIFSAAVRKESFYIPKEMVITGSINTEMSGQIGGVINGNVFAENKVIILKEGVINGDISAGELLVYGRINGDVLCANKMIVQNGAVIKGNIVTAEIHIEKETVIEGIITKSVINPPKYIRQTTAEPERKEQLIAEDATDIDRPDLPQKEELRRQAWF